MTARAFDPARLDVGVFANEGGELAGAWPLTLFRRVADTLAEAPDEASPVTWRARGERRTARGTVPQVWLHLHAAAQLPLQCQRCLQPVATAFEVDRSFRFVHGEEAAEKLDAEVDEDVLATPHALDLRELVEDELLLAMPIVPRHDVCPEPLPLRLDDEVPHDLPNPFAALAALKRAGPLN